MLNAKKECMKEVINHIVKEGLSMDKVKITCYGKTETMERNEAIKFYRECADWSEGSERERYVNILFGLMDGLNEVTDELY